MRSLVGMLLPLFLHSRSGEKQGFDARSRRAYDAKQTAYRAWCRSRIAENCGQFVLARVEAQRVYGAARESHNERTMNTLKHSTCSHEWWETLKCSIFGVKPSIPTLRGPQGNLVVASSDKDSRLGCQLNSKQFREQFVTLLSCFPQSMRNSWLSELRSSCVCFSILIRVGC